MSWKEFFVYGSNFTSLAAGSGTAFTDNEIRIDPDARFEFIKTMYFPITSRVRLRYRDDTDGRFLQKASQDCRTIGGHALYTMTPGNPLSPGFLPFVWPRPYEIAPATTFTVSAADFSGLSYTFRLAFHGSKVREGIAPWDKQFRRAVPYVYPLDSAGTISVAANGTYSTAIALDNDAPFLVQKLVGARTGECLVTIKDGDRDRQWMNQAIHFDNLIGNGHYPNILPAPRFIKKGGVIAVTVQDLSGAANTVEINFVGAKLYE